MLLHIRCIFQDELAAKEAELQQQLDVAADEHACEAQELRKAHEEQLHAVSESEAALASVHEAAAATLEAELTEQMQTATAKHEAALAALLSEKQAESEARLAAERAALTIPLRTGDRKLGWI